MVMMLIDPKGLLILTLIQVIFMLQVPIVPEM